MNALLRSDLRVLPAGSGIAVFSGRDVGGQGGAHPRRSAGLAAAAGAGRGAGRL